MSKRGAEEAKKFLFDTKPGPIDDNGRKEYDRIFGETDIFKNLEVKDDKDRKK